MTAGHLGVRTLVAGGVRLAYEVEGQGAAVLCIQGVGVAGSGWRPQVAGLSRGFRVITLDNRGIGRSEEGGEPATIETMAADALAVLDAEGVADCHLVGHSMGGLIALHIALTSRERVRSLSLLCTFAEGADATKLTPRMAWLGLRTRLGTRSMRRRGMLRMIMPPTFLRRADPARLARELEELFGRDLGGSPPVVMRQLRAMSRYGAATRLGELAGLPTLVVSGAQDPIARPASGRALAAAIPGARYVEMADASHALTIQCPREVNALLLEHLTAAEQSHLSSGRARPVDLS